jgi:hypothetical protein
MNIDTGLAVVIIAVLVFYLRLIILQRERAKRLAQRPKAPALRGKKAAGSKGENPAQEPMPRYSIFSQKPLDWIIAAAGALGILGGALLYARVFIIPAAQSYWWIPTSLGILAFSWAFKG